MKSSIRFASACVLSVSTSVARAQTAPGAASDDERWRRKPSMTCVTSATPVTLTSAEIARTIGLAYAEVQPAAVATSVERSAELTYNAARYARLAPRGSGVVVEVKADLGSVVKRGDVLAVIDSADLGGAKSDLLLALETAKLWELNAAREEKLVEQGLAAAREALEARTRAAEGRIAVNRARQKLRNLGLSKEQIAVVESEGDTSSTLELVAPFDGTIVELTAVMGELSEPAKPLLAVADTSRMWALIDLAEVDLAAVRVGHRAAITLDGLPDRAFEGKISWISSLVDPRTRTVKARVELDNAEGLLRANMFGRAAVSAGETTQSLLVPKDAVQWEGCCNVAFVRSGIDSAEFRPARLVLTHDAGDSYAVADGLKPHDTVVTLGSFILKNEILKNSVGAGCCEVDHLSK